MSRFICCEKQVVLVQEFIFSTAKSPKDGQHSKRLSFENNLGTSTTSLLKPVAYTSGLQNRDI